MDADKAAVVPLTIAAGDCRFPIFSISSFTPSSHVPISHQPFGSINAFAADRERVEAAAWRNDNRRAIAFGRFGQVRRQRRLRDVGDNLRIENRREVFFCCVQFSEPGAAPGCRRMTFCARVRIVSSARPGELLIRFVHASTIRSKRRTSP